MLLITGASGFVGRSLCSSLYKRGFSLRVFLAANLNFRWGSMRMFHQPCLRWTPPTLFFLEVQTVLHLAGRAHIVHETVDDPLAVFRKDNVYETLQFARQASLAGVRRFVYVSSIKVNGESSSPLLPFTENDLANPIEPYAISKYEAELGSLTWLVKRVWKL